MSEIVNKVINTNEEGFIIELCKPSLYMVDIYLGRDQGYAASLAQSFKW